MDAELRIKRLGKMTASMAPVIMGSLDTDGLEALVKRLAFERVFGDPEEPEFSSGATLRGEVTEPLALDEYEFRTGVILERGSHIDHPTIPMVAATPDGLGPEACVEAKSPLHRAWMHTQKTGRIPPEYEWQCAWQAWCADLWHTDFVSYHPKAPTKTKIIRYTLAPADVERMRARVITVEARIRAWVRILEE